MKAARFYDHHDIRIEQVPAPKPDAEHVLVDVVWAGICGTDLHEYLIGPKAIPTKDNPHLLTGDYLPVTLGHEFCGYLAHVPEAAVDASGAPLRTGQPVMVDPRLNCRSCYACHGGDSHLCGKWGFLGLHGAGGGGFSETCAVLPSMCYSLPDDTPLDHAVLIEPLAVGRHALVKSGLALDEFKSKSVLVLGGGPVGFAVLCNLAAIGVQKAFVSEPAKARQDLVNIYADQVLDPTKHNVPDECRASTEGKGVDVVFDCAGIPPAMKDGFDALRPKGVYVNVAGWEVDFIIPMEYLMPKEITIRSTLAYDDKDFGDTVKDFIGGECESQRYCRPN